MTVQTEATAPQTDPAAPPAPAQPAATPPAVPQPPAADPGQQVRNPDGTFAPPVQQPAPQQPPADTTDWKAVAEQARAEAAAEVERVRAEAQADVDRWKKYARQHEDRLKLKNETVRRDELFFEQVAEKLGIEYADKPDPEELARLLTQQGQLNRSLTVERAVYLAAASAGADPNALLDSRAFVDQTARINPDAADFAEQVRDLIRDAAKEDRYKLASPGLTPQTTQQPAQLQPAGQFQQPPVQQPAPVQQQPPAQASGADFSGAPPGDGLWDQATYDYWATGPGKAQDRDGKIMSTAIEQGKLVNLGVGRPRRPSSRR